MAVRGAAVVAPLATAFLIAACGHPAGVQPSASTTGSPVASASPVEPTAGVLSPSPQVTLPTNVFLSPPSAQVVWATIENSFLYRSTDGGTTWQQRPLPPHLGGGSGPQISFINDQQGWVLYGGVPATQCDGAGAEVWRTTDAGATWQEITSVDYHHQPTNGIGFGQCKGGLSFVDASHGYVIGSDPNYRPTIYRTADGGSTWAGTTLPDPLGFVSQPGGFTLQPDLIKGFNGTLLLPAWGHQDGAQMYTEYVFRSTDGGATWSYLAARGDRLANITFVTASRWLDIANDGSALETTDSGRSWHSYHTDYQDAAGAPSSFVFADPLVGYGTVRGEIHRTVNGGLNWVTVQTPGVS